MAVKKSILLMFHCDQNTGYAIEKLETTFEKAAIKAGFLEENIFWSYRKVTDLNPNVFTLNYQSDTSALNIVKIINEKNITCILAFDLPYPAKIAKAARKAGVKNIVSYYGASMSSLNSGLKLLAKRAEWFVCRNAAPDKFIFESFSMQKRATHGRGVPFKLTQVIPLGVDTNEYKPSKDKSYVKKILKIPLNRRVVIYSGHMEERKGVRTIVRATKYLSDIDAVEDIHFVLCGNKKNEADTYIEEVSCSTALNHLTFAGYRSDMPKLMASCDLGVIASTGWDSFTMSSIEMLASGLPLIVSDLDGLAETTIDGKTGELVRPGDYIQLAETIKKILGDAQLLSNYSVAARQRAVENFSVKLQIDHISKSITSVKD